MCIMQGKRIKQIEELAKSDITTKDRLYNNGLQLILKYGFLSVYGHPDVQYWCMCNNI